MTPDEVLSHRPPLLSQAQREFYFENGHLLHDPRPCPIPPDWSGGYTSLIALQQGESWDEEPLATVAEQTRAIRPGGR